MRSAFLVALAFLAGAVTTAYSATNDSPRYTLRERAKLHRHACRTEDSYMFIPARRIKAGVSWPLGSHDHVYCVQVDNAYRASR